MAANYMFKQKYKALGEEYLQTVREFMKKVVKKSFKKDVETYQEKMIKNAIQILQTECDRTVDLYSTI